MRIECRDVRKRARGQDILAGIDFSMSAGERVALLGLNGAGKTTLLRCVLGLARYRGSISIDGHDPSDVASRSRIGYVPQQPPRFDLTLDAFLSGFAGIRGVDAGSVRARALRFGLDPVAHGAKKLTELSGGMLQKAVLALALAGNPRLLLLDEPTANLDATSREGLMHVLDHLEPGVSVILSSHRLSDFVRLAGRAMVLRAGSVAFDGPLSDLLDGWEGDRRGPPRASERAVMLGLDFGAAGRVREPMGALAGVAT